MDFKLFLNLTCDKGININKMQEVIPDSFFEVIGSSYNLKVPEAQFFNAQFYKRFLSGQRIEEIIKKINPLMISNKMSPVQHITNTQMKTYKVPSDI